MRLNWGKKKPKHVAAYEKVRDTIASCKTINHLRSAKRLLDNYGNNHVAPFGWTNVSAYKRERILNRQILDKIEEVKAKIAKEAAIELSGYDYGGGSKDDVYITHFKAVAPNGETVEGCVTKGWLKGSTIRLND